MSTPQDLTAPNIYTAVAKRLGQWHAKVDTKGLMEVLDSMGPRRKISRDSGVPELIYDGDSDDDILGRGRDSDEESLDDKGIEPGQSELWKTLGKWIEALPEGNEKQSEIKQTLDRELSWIEENAELRGLGEIVFGHCDLLSGNVIILPKKDKRTGFCPADIGDDNDTQVTFIDYE